MKNRQLPHLVFWLSLIGFFPLTTQAQNTKTTNNTRKAIVPQKQVDVYAAGISRDKITGKYFATYWKNGEEIRLTDGQVDVSEAKSIFVSGNDVHVTGTIHPRAIYWKNRQPIELPTPISKAGASGTYITVVGNDVYITGADNSPNRYEAKYWKNGQPVLLLLSKDFPDAYTKFISLIDNDVYVIGESAGWVSVYWKNGQNVKTLTDGFRRITTITQQGGHTYAVGDYDNHAAYWKNGKTTILTSQISFAKYVAVAGNDIYVAGVYDKDKDGNALVTDGDGGIYWKNGVEVELGGTNRFYQPTSMVASGNDVYVTAYDRYETGKLWKNGQRVELPNAYRINQVIVVERAASNSTKVTTTKPMAEKKQVIQQAKVIEKTQPYVASPPSAKERADQFLAENKKKPGVITTASGFQYQVLKEGTGAKPLSTDRVKVHFLGTFTNGIKFKSADVHIIPKNSNPGWAEGISLMRVGSKYKFFVPSKLTFGRNILSEMLTPEDPIILEVDVLGIEN